jgi:hypothetical protein
MNVELEEVVVQDVSGEALELAAGGEGGSNPLYSLGSKPKNATGAGCGFAPRYC